MFTWTGINPDLVKKIKNFCEELFQINKDNIVSMFLLSESSTLNWIPKDPIKILVIVDSQQACTKTSHHSVGK